jgi:hypothetical protein
MADILITAVSAAYTGTDGQDDIRNATGNLRDITIAGLSGDDLLSMGSAATQGTGAGGIGLGFSIGSSEFKMGAGNDTVTFSGESNSGFAKFESMDVRFGQGDDFSVINGLASASGSTIKGNEGNDEITFASQTGGATATNVVINGNAGDDSISATWTGTEAKSFSILAGADNDTIRAVFSAVSSDASASSNNSATKIGGNKGNDLIFYDQQGTAEGVRINGNSGADTLNVTAAEDVTNFVVAGGQGDDSVSATFAAAASALGASVNGSVGNDSVVVDLNTGGFASGFTLGGNSGNDVLTLTANAYTFGSANSILGGTGADTININVAGDLTVTGASGFVADLGAAGTVSGGSAGLGGQLNVGLSAAIDGAAIFRGTTAGDDINISNIVGAGSLSGATFSAEDGADSITFTVATGGAYSAVSINAGAGADLITAQLAGGVGTNYAIATGGLVTIDAGAGADTMIVNVGAQDSAGTISAGIFNGGSGADSITFNLLFGSDLETVNTGTVIDGGSGADTIGLLANASAGGSTADVQIRGGVGADLITAQFGSGGGVAGEFGSLTADGGAGADTISVVFSATSAATGGYEAGAGSGGVFGGGADADSISVNFDNAAVGTGGIVKLGSLRGGAGADTLTLGANLGITGEESNIRGSFNGGAGADSLVFSGNNLVSGAVATFDGLSAGSAGFVFASGDSLAGGFDTVFMSNVDVTGGQTMSNGNFGSAGFLFTGFNAVSFTMAVESGGAADTAGRVLTNDAIFRSNVTGGDWTGGGANGISYIKVNTGGSIGMVVTGGEWMTAGVNGTFIASGGSTTAQIFSAVDRVTTDRGNATVFNVQNGSAGTIDGFMFVQGGIEADTVVKFEGNGVENTTLVGSFYFSGDQISGDGVTTYVDGDNSLNHGRSQNDNSGGQIFFGSNVGVG